jgi:hypothetical protein
LHSKEGIQNCYNEKNSFLKFGLKRILYAACDCAGGYDSCANAPTHMLRIITTAVARNQDTFQYSHIAISQLSCPFDGGINYNHEQTYQYSVMQSRVE